MTGGPGESWQEREARRRRVAQEARQLPREPASWWARLGLGVATAAWVATLVWLATVLPERVPTHWSTGGTPDGWSSRTATLVTAVLVPLLLVYPMVWLSGLVLLWPAGINAPHKEWWVDRPRRLVRFARLVREDLMVFTALTVLLFVAIELVIGYAAHQPGGTVPGWWFPVVVGVYVVALAGWIVVMYTGGRYRPDDSAPDLR